MHTSDNFLDIHNDDINLFTLSNLREMCSFESFSSRGCLTWSCFVNIRLPLWRHRACIATYSPRKARCWLEDGDTDLSADNSASKITWFDSYKLNDHGRMDIDHVLRQEPTRRHKRMWTEWSSLQEDARGCGLSGTVYKGMQEDADWVEQCTRGHNLEDVGWVKQSTRGHKGMRAEWNSLQEDTIGRGLSGAIYKKT